MKTLVGNVCGVDLGPVGSLWVVCHHWHGDCVMNFACVRSVWIL